MLGGDDLRPTFPLPEALSREYLENYLILPLALAGGRVRVAAAGEPDPQALDDLAILFDAQPDVIPVDEALLRDAIRRAMDENTRVVELLDPGEAAAGLPNGSDDLLADVRDLATQPPVIRYVSLLLRDAHGASASDIHLESTRDGLRVRFRVDGVLSDADPPPRELAQAVVSRVKLLANLDIAERRVPQDGRIRVRLEDRELDLRVSTLPALHGESVVLRLLDRGGRPAGLDQLGMDAETYGAFSALAQRPHGIVLVTGPTGSGKTTTLHAALGLRDATSEKIVTVEDPIEYQLAGVIQIPVNAKAGATFATVLRGVLRHDPDVVMVGEMRDQETASIAVRAALTGHLVFSTLHTNDALSAIARLSDLGVEEYLVASTVEGVLAQRLVRRVCPECRRRYTPDPQTVALLAGRPVGTTTLERGAGCPACRQTGFKGRTGLFELLVFDEELKELVTRRAGRSALREAEAVKRMRTLRDDGWIKVQAGISTVEEVLRVSTA
jgi:type II secretory ATPase GspE/PulE/Tfp pilus assembly ATPase PilB-like protein